MLLRSRPTVKHGPRAAITTTRISSSSASSAIITGRSSQNAGPKALRRSGLSSHSVATWPSRSMVRTLDVAVMR